MANRVYLLPRRNDLEGAGIYVRDLRPNSSQRNLIYDGEGQTHYLGGGLEPVGATVFIGDAYVSGPRNTTIAANVAADDTTGGGNDVQVHAVAHLGLTAYLQDRVHAGGVGNANADCFTAVQANAAAAAIALAAEAGNALTLAAINTLLSNQVAQSDLDGAAVNSKSFGTVVDVLRILAGEVYLLPRFTIITNDANQFRSLAERNVLVAAQNVAANGGTTFLSQGRFLTSTDAGFRGRPILARTQSFNGSNGGGHIATLKNNVEFINPAYAYAAADVTPFRPRATALDGVTAIAATGIHPVVRAYDHLGNAL